jgi:poly-gamma-glutamate synthesis protein (capsule biosynthesis protein)
MKKCFLFLLLFSSLVVLAQPKTEEEKVINIKNRFLKFRNQESDLDKVDSFQTLHLMVAGNIYHNEEQIGYAFDTRKGRYDFGNLFKYIQPILNIGHLTIANLKTSFSGGVPDQYCAPDEMALAVKYAGINALVNANIQTANIDRDALKRERELMSDMDVYMTGAFADNIDRNGNYPLIINKRGFKIALLNYSSSLAGRTSISRNFIINEADKSAIERDMRLVRAQRPDFTIIYFDWGNQNQDIPSNSQVELARYAFQLGANLVVGTHPNLPMGIDLVNYYYNGQYKEGLVAYSLGNLVGSGREDKNRNGFVLDVELKKNTFTHDTKLEEWGVIPVYTYYDTTTTEGKTKVFVLPCAAVESGDIFSNLPYIEKRKTIIGAFASRKLVGGMADEIQYNVNEMAVNNVVETILLTHASLNNKYSPMTMDDIKKRGEDRQDAIAVSKATQLPNTNMLLNQSTANNSKQNTTANSTNASSANAPASNVSGTVASGTAPTADLQKQNTKDQARKQLDSVMNEVDMKNYNIEMKSSKNSTGTSAKQGSSNAKQTQGAVPNQSNTTVAKATETTQGSNSKATSSNNLSNTSGGVSISSPETKTSANNSSTAQTAETASSKNPTTNTSETENATRNAANNSTQTTYSKARAVTDDINTGTNQTKQTSGNTTYSDPKNNTSTSTTNYKSPGTYKVDNNQTVTPSKGYKLKENEVRPNEEAAKTSNQSVSGLKVPDKAIELSMDRIDAEDLKLRFDTFYRIQFYALKKMIPLDTNYYTHLKGYEVLEEDSLYKYLLGKYNNYDDAYNYWTTQIQPRYKQSFIRKMVYSRRIIR